MQYFLTHSEMFYFLGIFIKGRLVKISENIAFLFYKEIYMKYLILYYKTLYDKVCDLLQVCGFLLVLWFPPSIINDRHKITEILLKVALNTISLTPQLYKNSFDTNN